MNKIGFFVYPTYMIKNFFTCGTVGWCLEILFTACGSLRKKNYKLIGNTSLWMFPIYGMAAILEPVSRLLKKQSFLLRGSVYTLCIFTAEFLTGNLLKKRGMCPWSYDQAKYNISGLIRLDYAPLWFGTGLLYEHILTGRRNKKTTAM